MPREQRLRPASLAAKGAQQRCHLRRQCPHAHRIAGRVAATPGKGEDLIDLQYRAYCPLARSTNLVKNAEGRMLFIRHLGIAEDGAHDVVEVVRDTAGDMPPVSPGAAPAAGASPGARAPVPEDCRPSALAMTSSAIRNRPSSPARVMRARARDRIEAKENAATVDPTARVTHRPALQANPRRGHPCPRRRASA